MQGAVTGLVAWLQRREGRRLEQGGLITLEQRLLGVIRKTTIESL